MSSAYEAGSPDTDTEGAPEAAAPVQSEGALPGAEAEASPSLSDAAPAGWIGGSQDAAPASAGQTAAPAQTSAFGPQSLNADYQGSPYADMGPGPASFDSRFGDWGQQDAAPSSQYQDALQTLGDLTQSALSGYDYEGSPYADMGQQPTAPDFSQAFQAFEAQPGWNPAEQTAGRAGLAEPTDWGANPFAPSTDVSVGRDFDQVFADVANQPTDYEGSPYADMGPQFAPDFNQAFQAFDTPTGMDLAGDFATGVTTNLANQLGLNDLTVGPGLPTSPVFGVTGLNYNTLTHDTDPTAPVNVELMQVPAPATPTPLTVDPSTTGQLQDAQQAPQEAQPAQPQEAQPQAPQEAQQAPPQEAQEAQQQAQEAQQAQPQEAQPQTPQEAQQAPPPSLIEQVLQETPPAPPALPPVQGLYDMAPMPVAPQQQPVDTPMPQARPSNAPQPQDPNDDTDDEADPHANTPVEPGRPLGAPTTRTQNTPVVSPRVIQEQQGKTRDRPINERLHGILSQAAEQAGVIVRIGSGGQVATRAPGDRGRQGGWTGSIRHNHGNAADVRLEQNGRVLNYNNPQDRVVMEAFVREAARLGATGMGAGMRYMGPNTIHVGFGNPNFWRADNEGSRGLRQAWAEGRQGPANRPPADIPIRTAVIPPLPRRRPDEPQPTVTAQPDVPPAPPPEVPTVSTRLPPQVPQETQPPAAPVDRPPADIPVTLTPPAVAARTAQAATQFAKFLADNLSKSGKLPSNREEGQAALNALAQELAKAGYPASVAQRTILETATQGSIKAGYGPDSKYNVLGHVTRAINEMVGTAMQGYRTGKTPEAQGPPSPFAPAAPGKRSAAPFGQQFAGLSQSRGPAPGEDYGREGDVGAASPYFGATTPTVPQLSPMIAPPAPAPSRGRPPAPPPPPMYTPGGPGMFNPFRGNEAALPGGLFHLAAGGRDVGAPPAIQPGQLPGQGRRGSAARGWAGCEP